VGGGWGGGGGGRGGGVCGGGAVGGLASKRENCAIKINNEHLLWIVSPRGGDAIPLPGRRVSSSHPPGVPDGKYSPSRPPQRGKNQCGLLDRPRGESQKLTEVCSKESAIFRSGLPIARASCLILPIQARTEAAKESYKDNLPLNRKLRHFRLDRLQFKQTPSATSITADPPLYFDAPPPKKLLNGLSL